MPRKGVRSALVWLTLVVVGALAAAPVAAAPGDLYVTDAGALGGLGGVLRVTPSGAQTVVAGNGSFTDPAGVVIAPDDSILIADFATFGSGTGSLVRVDPVTGTQTVLATAGNLVDPWGIVLDGTNAVDVADPSAAGGAGAIVRIDLGTGAQTVISSGGLFADPIGLARAPDGRLYVADESAFGGNGGVIAVNPATGAQTTISSGGSFVDPVGLLVLPSGQIVVADVNSFGAPGLIRVDPTSGSQTMLTTGGSLAAPRGLALAGDGRILVADANALGGNGGVIAVDPATGAQATISSGQFFSDPSGLAVIQNKLPTASFTVAPNPVTTGSPVLLDAGASSDPDAPLGDYRWDLDGNGSYETDNGAVPLLSHTFDTTGPVHISLRVTDSSGATADTSRDLLVDALPAPPAAQNLFPSAPFAAPILGETVNATPLGGTVLVREPGSKQYVPLTASDHLPMHTQVDVRRGRIRLTASDGVGPRLETGTFYKGMFQIRQRRTRFAPVELLLIGPSTKPPVLPGTVHLSRRKQVVPEPVRELWAATQGTFRTRGTYASATVRGTQWVTQDLKIGTKVHVRRGSVVVRDFVRHTTVTVRSPQSYLATSPRLSKRALGRSRRG